MKLNKIKLLLKSNKLLEAEEILNQSIKEAPDSLSLQQYLADLYTLKGDISKSIQISKGIEEKRRLNLLQKNNNSVKNNNVKCIIIDPIFRGSRLYYTVMIASAIKNNFDLEILTREHTESGLFNSYRELLADFKLNNTLSVPKDLWYGSISTQVCKEIIDRIVNTEETTIFIFSGLNEVYQNIIAEVNKHQKTFKHHFIAYEYDAKSLKEKNKKLALESLANLFKSTTIFILDESFKQADFDIKQVKIKNLPDPIPETVDNIRHILNQKSTSDFITDNNPQQQTSFLTVGLQSHRKGIRDLIRVARKFEESNLAIKIFISGKLQEDIVNLRPQIKNNRQYISFREDYVSDAEILRTYNTCDFVLLPYAKDFSGSSGVFAYAMALGKPVISTNHGCIGWRVKQYNLGLTYQSGDIDGLLAAIKTMTHWAPEKYKEYQDNCFKYFENNSYETALDKIQIEIDQVNQLNQQTFALETQALIEAQSFDINTIDNIEQICLFDTGISSRNMGDHIIVDSIKNHLRKIFPNAIFVSIPTHEYLATEALKLLETSKVKLVCGTNLLASHMDEYKQWKIGGYEFAILKELTLLGCGWWQYQDKPNLYTQALLNKILSNNTLHSVRDNYTLQQLDSLQNKQIVNTTCPTLWSLTPEHLTKIPPNKSKNVVTTLTDYKADPIIDKYMLDTLCQYYQFVFVWIQGTGDFNYLKRLYDNKNKNLRVIPATLEAYDEILESSIELDYIGTRLHAGVRALQKKRRALILAVDNRAKEISADTGLPCIQREEAPIKLEKLIDVFSVSTISLPIKAINAWTEQFR
jgi:glycosyltransferase involved in cell wall biosynthesis/polysaccharide pyruvyl transferase WcaK-like protein